MFYSLKRYLLFQIKNFENFFETRKKQREIAKAYHVEQRHFRVVLSRPIIIWAGVAVLSISIITLGVVYSGQVINVAQNRYSAWQNKNRERAEERKQQELKKAAQKKAEALKKQQQAVKVKPVDKSVVKDTVPVKPPVIHEPAPVETPSELEKFALPFSRELQFCILANKKTKTMYVLQKRPSGWAIFLRYSIAIGEQEGQKVKAGDKKTPEGLYFIIGRKENTELPIMYGPLAFVLNYPNADDRKNHRTGNGIWIHGTNPDSLPDRTSGCLELENPNISQLGTYLKTGIGTPVIITYDDTIASPATYPDFARIEAERQEIVNSYIKKRDLFITLLNQWKDSWEKRDIDLYSRFYDPERFYGQGMKWDAYKEHKARTFLLYDTIRISLDKIYLSELSESTAVLKFLQGYQSERLQVVNGKKLYFVKDNNEWKIYRESTMSNEELLL